MASTATKRTTASSAKTGGGKAKGKKPNVFHQRLASLTFHQACQLLGQQGDLRMRQGSRFTEIDPERDVFLGGDLLRVKVHDCGEKDRGADDAPEWRGTVITTITLQSSRSKQLQVNCDSCDVPCHHLGDALDYLLDAKSVLGLAAPPDESVPLENSSATSASGRRPTCARCSSESRRSSTSVSAP